MAFLFNAVDNHDVHIFSDVYSIILKLREERMRKQPESHRMYSSHNSETGLISEITNRAIYIAKRFLAVVGQNSYAPENIFKIIQIIQLLYVLFLWKMNTVIRRYLS